MTNKKILRILVACEESQTVTKAFRNLGHEAYSCDIQPCGGGHPEWHLQQDVTELLSQKWDIIIAHPPCTHLAVSGSRFFKVKREDGRQREAIDFFMKFINADCQMIAVENPIGIIGGNYIAEHFPDLAEKYQLPLKHSQIIQPFEFGDPVKKSTCLWLKGLPNLKPTNNVAEQVKYYINKKGGKESEWNMRQLVIDGKKYGYNSVEFKKHRSKTFQGIADAIATQYTAFALSGLSVEEFKSLTIIEINQIKNITMNEPKFPIAKCSDIPEMTDAEFEKIKQASAKFQKNALFCLTNAHLIHGEAACTYFLYKGENPTQTT